MTAPTISHPTPGQSVPIGDQCPTCGVLRQHWVYNPFVRSSRDNGGWIVYQSRICDCPDSDPWRRPTFSRAREPHDQAWLDRELNRESSRHLTYASFSRRSAPELLPALEFCQRYSERHRQQPQEIHHGVYLAGPATPEREHLLAALANAARAAGCPTALVTHCQVMERITPPERDTEWASGRYRELVKVLRSIPLLLIAGLLATPTTPVELKHLFSLIDHRAQRGLPTHFSAHAAPKALRDGARAMAPPGLQAFTVALEQCTLQAIPCPSQETNR